MEESWPSTESSSPLSPERSAGKESRAQSAEESPPAREVVRADVGWSEGRESGPVENSIIAKYIQRFRNAKPMSREDREQGAADLDPESREFWWLRDSPPDTSTPTEGRDRFNQGIELFTNMRGGFENQSPLRLDQISSMQRNILPPSLSLPSLALLKIGLSSTEDPLDVCQLEPFDPETIRLQDRANRLLDRSESSLSGPVPVSSDGVGSSSLSDGVSAEEVPRRPFSIPPSEPTAGDGTTKRLPVVSDPRCTTRALPFIARPERDILDQWRLHRKMETARDSPWPFIPHRTSQSPPVRLPRQMKEADHDAPEERPQEAEPCHESCRDRGRGGMMPVMTPAYCAGTNPGLPQLHPAWPQWQPPAIACRPDRQDERGEGRSLGSGGERGQGRSLGSGEGERGEGRPLGSEGERGKGRSLGSEGERGEAPSLGSEGERGQGRSLGSEGERCCTRTSVLPLPARIPRHPVTCGNEPSPPDPRGCTDPPSCRPDPDQESSSDEFWSPPADNLRPRKRSGVRAGPARRLAQSDVRHVLGQVVSERIFSPPALPRRAGNKPEKGSEHRQSHSLIPDSHPSPSPIPGARRTPAAVTQLLQEAEESDGVEFEEDSLLQVLRQQRDWVRQQLREADMRLRALDCHER
uniref:proline and serine-rich protein 3 n=1 Tax=Pristiophorus japonicus TaxID=55135 RepID=UPI00398E630E